LLYDKGVTSTIDNNQVAASLRLIARGFEGLARALVDEPMSSRNDRVVAAMSEWGTRGLSRGQASDLFKKHGLNPQTSGGWARGGWIETRQGMRYLTERSIEWLARDTDDRRADGPVEGDRCG
jgi:hypothetical protein